METENLSALHAVLQERCGSLPDIVVFSDGSGYEDGLGGWASYCMTPDGEWKTFRSGIVLGTTVDRAEMTAMLEGLQQAYEMAYNLPERDTPGFKARVVVFTDRENMVLSSQGVYDRSNCRDLWERYEFYEKRMMIKMIHVQRETDYSQFQLCDLTASTGRLIAKSVAVSVDTPPWKLQF